MKKFLLSAALMAAASALHAGIINYNANVGLCNGTTCVLDVLSLTWIEPTPVYFALVTAGSDTFTPSLIPAAVGGIVPSSQAFTISTSDANIFTNGAVFYLSTSRRPSAQHPTPAPKLN